jgi:hypothetical protein
MDKGTTIPARATVWDVAAVLDLAAREVRAPGTPAPSWEETLERVRAARAQSRKRMVSMTRQGMQGRRLIAVPYA